MAFTKIVGAGIHTLSNVNTHNINSSGIITATKFTGLFDGSSGDFSGNVTIDGNLIVNGTTTTLDTTLQEVDQLFVSANNSTVGVAITQSGSGDILNLYDGSTEVFSVTDGGSVRIGDNASYSASTGADDLVIGGTAGQHGMTILTGNNSSSINFADSAAVNPGAITYNHNGTQYMRFRVAGGEKVRINSSGQVGIGTDDPNVGTILDVYRDDVSDAGSIQITQDGTGDAAIDFQLKGTQEYSLGIDNSDSDKFKLSGSAGLGSNDLVTVTTAGKVGIGSEIPQAQLDVTAGAVVVNSFLKTTSSKSYIEFEHNAGTTYNTRFGSATLGAGNVGFIFETGLAASPVDAMVIDRYGKVGINTTTPDTPLHIYANDSQQITVERASNANSTIRYKNTVASMYAGLMTNATGFAIDSDDNLGVAPMFMVKQSSGDVGIGTTNPTAKFHIFASNPTLRLTDSNQAADNKTWNIAAGIDNILRIQAINDAGSGGGRLFEFYRNGNNVEEFRGMKSGAAWFTINNNDETVGIGTTNPESPLSIFSDAADEELLHFDMGSAADRRGWKFKQGDTGTATQLVLQADENGKAFQIKAASGAECFYTYTASSGAYVRINSELHISDTIQHIGDSNTKIRFPADDTFSVETAGSERVRIVSDGKILIGDDTSEPTMGLIANIQTFGTDAGKSSIAIRRGSNDAQAAFLVMSKSRNTSVGSRTILQNGDEVGNIFFVADDGTDLASNTAAIKSQLDGIVGVNSTPGNLTFWTTSDNANSATERLRITSSGTVGINCTPLAFPLEVRQQSANGGALRLRDASATYRYLDFDVTGALTQITARSNNSHGHISIGTTDQYGRTTQLYIKGGANAAVGIGTDSPSVGLDVKGHLAVGEDFAVNRPRIILSAPDEASNYRHLFGANLKVDSSGTFTTPSENISGGGWLYRAANSINAYGHMTYMSAPDTNGASSTPLERLRIDAAGRVLIGDDTTPNAVASVAVVGSYGSSSNLTPFVYLCRDEIISDAIGANESLGQILFASKDGYRGAVIESRAAGVWSSSSSDGYLVFKTTPDNSTVPSEIVRITSEGKVGISTAAPTAKLSVGRVTGGYMNMGGIQVNRPHSLGLQNGILVYADNGYNPTASYRAAAFKAVGTTGAALGISTDQGSNGLGGTLNARIDFGGNAYFLGNIGIGTDNITHQLTVLSPDTVGSTENDRAYTSRFTTKNPTSQLNLDIYDRRWEDSQSHQWHGTEKRIEYNVNGDSNKRMWMSFFNQSTSTTSNTIRFGEQEDTEWMRIQDGTVGIGTTNTDGSPLYARANDASALVLERTSTNNCGMRFRNNTSSMFAGLAGNALGFAIDDDENLGVDPMMIVRRDTGRLGINAGTAPGYRLHVYEASVNTIAAFESGDGGAGILLKDDTHHTRIETTDGAFKIDVDVSNEITAANRSLSFQINASTKLSILNSGQVNVNGNMQFTAANPEIELNNGGPRFRVPAANTLAVHSGGTLGSTNNEQLRITSGVVQLNAASNTHIRGGVYAKYTGASGNTANINTSSIGKVSWLQTNTEIFENGGFTNTATDVTVPFDGIYMVMFNGYLEGTSGAARTNVRFRYKVNGTDQNADLSLNNYIRHDSAHDESSVNFTAYLNLSAGDTVAVSAQQIAAAGTVVLVKNLSSLTFHLVA